MMRDFPSCFGESGVQVADSSSSNTARSPQNLVTCVYQCRSGNTSVFITVSWIKNLVGQGLTVGIDDSSNQCLGKVDIKPWLFARRKGNKYLEVDSNTIYLYWDMSSARFGSGPEPLEGFYLAVVFNQELILLLGDLEEDAYNKIEANPVASEALLVAKKENISGKKFYAAKAQFFGKGMIHDILIEFHTDGITDPWLGIRIDGKSVVEVKRLRWKFRGNHNILVEGLPVEVYWDVHSWLFANVMGHAVFLFQTCLSADDKFWTNHSISNSSKLGWSWPKRFGDSRSDGLCFSLTLYAWKNA